MMSTNTKTDTEEGVSLKGLLIDIVQIILLFYLFLSSQASFRGIRCIRPYTTMIN